MSTQGDIEPARIRSNRANSSNTANAHFGTSGARTSAGSGTFETALELPLELPLESDVEPDACCRTSSSGPELSSGQTWLSTDQQSGRLLYMSTSPGRRYDQSTKKQLSKITDAQRLATQTATQPHGCAIVVKSAASNFENILTHSSKKRSARAQMVTANPNFLVRARELS